MQERKIIQLGCSEDISTESQGTDSSNSDKNENVKKFVTDAEKKFKERQTTPDNPHEDKRRRIKRDELSRLFESLRVTRGTYTFGRSGQRESLILSAQASRKVNLPDSKYLVVCEDEDSCLKPRFNAYALTKKLFYDQDVIDYFENEISGKERLVITVMEIIREKGKEISFSGEMPLEEFLRTKTGQVGGYVPEVSGKKHIDQSRNRAKLSKFEITLHELGLLKLWRMFFN